MLVIFSFTLAFIALAAMLREFVPVWYRLGDTEWADWIIIATELMMILIITTGGWAQDNVAPEFWGPNTKYLTVFCTAGIIAGGIGLLRARKLAGERKRAKQRMARFRL